MIPRKIDPMHAEPPITIAGLGALSSLGESLPQHQRSLEKAEAHFRPLGQYLGADSIFARYPAAWIGNRDLLIHRKWSPSTMAALHVVKQAVDMAGWQRSDLHDAGLVFASSRGNAAGWLGPWPGRRPFRLMATSNTMHGEPAAAISIGYGIHGPNHVIASGCSAGLDAIGISMMMMRSGICKRVLAVAVELPLVPLLLQNYHSSGLLSDSFAPDPYHPESNGFVPGEGAAAMALEMRAPGEDEVSMLHYSCNSDASDPIGIPGDGGKTPELLVRSGIDKDEIGAICPHATGTAVQRKADPAWMHRVFADRIPPVVPLKSMLGHTIGASGMLESVILADFMMRESLPPTPRFLHLPEGLSRPEPDIQFTGSVAKIAHSMGGHNSLLVMSSSILHPK